MKIDQIRQISVILSELSKKKMPVKLGFAVSVNLEEMIRWAEKVEKERIELCKKYAKKDDQGDPVITDDRYEIEDFETLTKEMGTLMEEEIDLAIRKVPEELFDLIDSSDRYDALTADEIGALQFMIDRGGGD